MCVCVCVCERVGALERRRNREQKGLSGLNRSAAKRAFTKLLLPMLLMLMLLLFRHSV